MVELPAPARPRNAAATRQAILEAAKNRFATEGYDGASLRDIAADAGVDAALVSRYFGSKDELFVEVLNLTHDPSEIFEGGLENFGERIARMMLEDPKDAGDLDWLLLMLRSASSPRAAEAIRHSSRVNFHDPFAAFLGGPDAHVRARLAGAIMMGVAIARAMTEDHDLDAEGRENLCRRLADILQRAIEP
jgi:AcrR family transcriptional regulator